MQKYFISPYQFTRLDTSEPAAAGFSVLIFSAAEWDELPKWIGENAGPIDKQLLEDLQTGHKTTQPQSNALLSIIPKVVHLGKEIHYVCYRDMDERAQARPISFCLTSQSIILLEHTGISLQQIERWAKRGVLNVPMDLANIIALEVFYHYQKVLDGMEEHLYELENDILAGPKVLHQSQIMDFHKQVMAVKKAVNLHQTVFARLADIDCAEKLKQELVQTTDRLLDNIQSVHDMVENLRDAYQTAVQNYTNDIMKVLTLLATILLPINLLTSFFGMNFINMPLIRTSYGLTVFYVLSVIITAAALAYFRKRNWLFLWHRN